MSTASGTVTQSAGGSVLTYRDTGTYGTVSSRILVVYDPNGNILQTTPMGASLTASYDISIDQWLRFQCIVIDNTGTFTATVDYLSTAFYDNTYVNILAQLGCGCDLKQFNYIDISYFFRNAALRLALGGFAVAANLNVIAANAYINGN